MINTGTFLDAIENRPAYKPLITVSNHYSCIDDLVLFGQALPYKLLLDADRLSAYFASGKGIPVWRRVRDPKTGNVLLPGLGVCQPSMEFCLDLLNAGHWIHLFSQGRVIHPHERNNETNIRLRWGVGRLLAEASEDPVVLPIWHCGIDEMSPCKEPYARHTLARLFGPRLCVTALIGAPFEVRNLARKSGVLRSTYGEIACTIEDSRTDVWNGRTHLIFAPRVFLGKIRVYSSRGGLRGAWHGLNTTPSSKSTKTDPQVYAKPNQRVKQTSETVNLQDRTGCH
ncbi:hypothetical protein TcWFU_008071 [Taenia crassiceps]|uniref:Tafazzin family protein n=1 Tax=Taenia crassiceps TaxID=6207 RepID=A0ABR4QSG6_9CEST